MTVSAPRDFTVLLPPGWARIPLDGREGARAAGIAAAKAAGLPQPQCDQVRQQLTQVLHRTLREARNTGGIDILVSLADSHGIPLAASCLISYLDRGERVPLGALTAELARGGDEVLAVETGGGPAVRRRRTEASVTLVDYFLEVPGRTGLLSLSFSTPVEPLAEALTLLFDAIAESLRWLP